MIVRAAGFAVDLNEETLEERRAHPRRRRDDLERTIAENVARCRLENPVSTPDNSADANRDGVSTIETEYEAFLTDPRRI